MVYGRLVVGVMNVNDEGSSLLSDQSFQIQHENENSDKKWEDFFHKI